MSEQTIELDCEPGRPRPDSLLPSVLKGTGLAPKEPKMMWFGHWIFDYSEVPAEEWTKVQAITKPRIEALYHEGRIRYGSW